MQLDFIDMVEEMGHAWGIDPREVFNMPWKKVKMLWESLQKRQRREFKQEAAFRGIDLSQKVAESVLGGGASNGEVSRPCGSINDTWRPVVTDSKGNQRELSLLNTAQNTEEGSLKQIAVDKLFMEGLNVKIVHVGEKNGK